VSQAVHHVVPVAAADFARLYEDVFVEVHLHRDNRLAIDLRWQS
jgi:hypothetical protein